MDKIRVKLHANSSKEEIEEKENDVMPLYEIWIKEKPVDNKANKRLIKLLKNYFKKDIKIVSGFKSRNKIIKIGD